MKRLLLLLVVAAMLFAGCSNENKEFRKKQEALENAFSNIAMGIDEAVAASIVKTWNVADTDSVITFNADGTAKYDDKDIEFECAVTEENEFLVKLIDGKDETIYYMELDTTGYGVMLTASDNSEELHLVTAEVELQTIGSEACSGLIGVWEDKGGNLYEFKKDFSFVITDDDGDVINGSFGVAKYLDTEKMCFMIKMPSGTLELEFEFEDGGNKLKLLNVGSDSTSYHYWTRK